MNEKAFAKVCEDKTREAVDGLDAFWATEPGMIEVCRKVFTAALGDRPNQLEKTRPEVNVSAAELLDIASAGGHVTEGGLWNNVIVGIQYLESWLGGSRAVGINNLMDNRRGCGDFA